MSWTLDTITLPDQLIWEDEFEWTPVSQETALSLTGALIIQEGAALAGRPITLKNGDDGCWTTRDVAQQLYAMAQTASKTMILTVNGTAHTVMWRRGSEPPIECRQIEPIMNPESTAKYVITALRFMEVGS